MKFAKPYGIYRKQNALQVSVLHPRWSDQDSNGNQNITKPGGLLLTAAKAIGEKKFNWDKDEVISIALSPQEAAGMFSQIKVGEKKFRTLHDRNMGTDKQGQIVSWLDVKPGFKQNDKKEWVIPNGYRVELGRKVNGETSKQAFTLGYDEMAMLKVVADYAIIHAHGLV